MRCRIVRRSCDYRAQDTLAVAVTAELPEKVGEIDRRRPKWRAEFHRGAVFSLGIGCLSTLCQEIPERSAGFRPFGIGSLGCNKFIGRLVEAGPVVDVPVVGPTPLYR